MLIEVGAGDLSGAGAALASVTQVGPVVTAIVVSGAGATAMCADLGARTIREEIDAMKVIGVDPIQALVVPRVIAATFVALMLYSVVAVVGLFGTTSRRLVQHVTPGAFVAGMTLLTGLPQVIVSLVKALLFGLSAGLIACYKGLHVGGGPRRWAPPSTRPSSSPSWRCSSSTFWPPPSASRWHRDLEIDGHHASTMRWRSGRPHPHAGRADGLLRPGAVEHPRRHPALSDHGTAPDRRHGDGHRGAGGHRRHGRHHRFPHAVHRRVDRCAGLQHLSNVGIEALTGFLGAFLNVRFIAPATAGVALAATIGAGATAQLGAMRINEEIDALEVMGIRPITYLASTRIVAGVVAVIPIYSVSVLMSFLATRFGTTIVYGQSRASTTTTSHVPAADRPAVVLRGGPGDGGRRDGGPYLYGYTATGGPAGVGEAVGRAVRTSITAEFSFC